jgi:hypothetical protein
MAQVALIIALADRAHADAGASAWQQPSARGRITGIVAELLDQPEYAAAAVDLATADRLVAAAIVAFYP